MKILLFRFAFIIAGVLVAGGIGGALVLVCRVLRMGLSAHQGIAVVLIFSLFGLATGIFSAMTFRPPSS